MDGLRLVVVVDLNFSSHYDFVNRTSRIGSASVFRKQQIRDLIMITDRDRELFGEVSLFHVTNNSFSGSNTII